MAVENLTLFCLRSNPEGVIQTVKKLHPELVIAGTVRDWSKVSIAVGKSRSRKSMMLLHDPEVYEGSSWMKQLLQLQQTLARYPASPHRAKAMELALSFNFALTVQADPELNWNGKDERVAILKALAQSMDGVFHTPTTLRSAEGRVLISSQGEHDPKARFPEMMESGLASDDDDLELTKTIPAKMHAPPSSLQVAKRCLVMMAISARAQLEQAGHANASLNHRAQQIAAWLKGLHIDDALEPDDWTVLQSPISHLGSQDTLNAMWYLEGLAVLAWALGRSTLPAYDEMADASTLQAQLGFMEEDQAKALLSTAKLRPPSELDGMQKHLFALHWRLREYRIQPQPMNFRAFLKECWFGPVDVSLFRFVDNDLALGTHPIHEAPKTLFEQCVSTIMERHRAINWLHWGGLYSETDTPT